MGCPSVIPCSVNLHNNSRIPIPSGPFADSGRVCPQHPLAFVVFTKLKGPSKLERLHTGETKTQTISIGHSGS